MIHFVSKTINPFRECTQTKESENKDGRRNNVLQIVCPCLPLPLKTVQNFLNFISMINS